MDSDDPDLQAFESNLRRILREREIGKAAALKSNLCPNASDPQSIGVSSKDSARRDSPVAHHLSRIRRIYQMITKHPQNGSSKGISTLKLAAGPQGKLMKTQFGQRWRNLPTVPVPVHCMEIFYNSAAEPDRELLKLRMEAMYRRNWRADDSRSSCVGV